ncbi:threonine-phosphate decarboxylase CobD [Chelatococcus sp. SYSU_G07232]|uniref:threonine-phosphate decarboxylase n=1 Tax=Chelatococcus albus TaxID=3047466 RepID=A0ABT7AJB2_9HYPH|nr:threonine-phosphate decarboxylase CobD [Chelatococcus sp. SYSU_G07232]MDJ1159464.1 threonine-phosphate decarboxylase CobD [Chelatococcus sp. SYSU_G07232]
MKRAPSTVEPGGPPFVRRGTIVLHGGDLGAARAAFPLAPEPWLDLSTGINPVPFPLPDIAPELWQRLPDRGEQALLEAAAARAYAAGREAQVVAAPGTQALIQLLPRLRPPGRVAVLGPTYAEHAYRWQADGHAVTVVSRFEDLAAADVAVVVNPNNPDGRTISADDLMALARRLAERDGLLVVDEAFADVAPAGTSLLPRLGAGAPPTVVLRSFGKFFGLAGVRLGFAVTGDVPLADGLRQMIGPWAVSGPTLAVGTRALGDGDWQANTRFRLACDALRLDAMLAEAGLPVRGGTTLFRLVETEHAQAWFEHLGRAGILVRRFGEDHRHLRFGLPGTEAGWRRLAAALGCSP